MHPERSEADDARLLSTATLLRELRRREAATMVRFSVDKVREWLGGKGAR